MRWLVLGLFVSLIALLVAAAGMTIHILLQRRALRLHPTEIVEVIRPEDEADIEPEV